MSKFSNIQHVDVSASFANGAGTPVVVRNIKWSSFDALIADVEVNAEDASKAVLHANGHVGATKIAVTAEYVVSVDADGVEQVVPVYGEADIEVTESGAVFVSFAFGEPKDQ